MRGSRLCHERESRAHVILTLAVEQRRLRAVFDVKLNVRRSVMDQSEIPEALSAEPDAGLTEVRIFNEQRRVGRKRRRRVDRWNHGEEAAHVALRVVARE